MLTGQNCVQRGSPETIWNAKKLKRQLRLSVSFALSFVSFLHSHPLDLIYYHAIEAIDARESRSLALAQVSLFLVFSSVARVAIRVTRCPSLANGENRSDTGVLIPIPRLISFTLASALCTVSGCLSAWALAG